MDGWLVLLMAIGIPVAIGVLIFNQARDRRKRAFERIAELIWEHRDVLARERMHKVSRDPYGNVVFTKWLKELKYFEVNVILPQISEFPSTYVSQIFNRDLNQFDVLIAQRERELTGGFDFHDAMPPTDYERMCASLLERGGWSARLTPGSGDQGADIIASKGSVSVVVQCKLYGRPVGNKAVQEVSAARLHFRARHAVVVSNKPFTPSAHQLAKSTDTILLHHTELAELDHRISSGN